MKMKKKLSVSINMQTALRIDRGAKDSDQEQSENESDGGESCGEESGREDNYSMTSGEDSEMQGCPANDRMQDDEPIILTSEKSVKDQLKFIICEESIARTFAWCLKCESRCSVLVTSVIGNYYYYYYYYQQYFNRDAQFSKAGLNGALY